MAFAPTLLHDELNEQRPIIGPLIIHSDGVWQWPADLAYYVDHYHVALPAEFLTHLERQRFQPPAETPDSGA